MHSMLPPAPTLWVGEPQGFFFTATAAVGRGLVFATAFNSPFLAYDAETGEIAWDSGFDGLRAAPTLQGRRLYFYRADDLLHALDPETGTEIWSGVADGSNTGQAPVVQDGRVFQSLDGLTAYDVQTGEILWHKSETGSGSGVVATRGGYSIGACSKVAVERGRPRCGDWRIDLGNAHSRRWHECSTCVADGKVFVTFVDLFALDAKTGVEVWRVPGVQVLRARRLQTVWSTPQI